jgi:hypothetical protein
MERKKTNWILIIAGIFVFVLVVGVGLVATVGYMIYRQASVQTETVSTDAAEAQFEQVLTRFAGQRPFLQLQADGGDLEAVVEREPSEEHPGDVSSLHVMVWDPHEDKVVRVTMPFWIVRLTGDRPLNVQAGDSRLRINRLRVSARDIERLGPGLILDHVERSGERILIWTD